MLGIPVWAWIIVLLAALGLSTLNYYKILRNRGSQIWWVAFGLRVIDTQGFYCCCSILGGGYRRKR